MAEQLIDLKPGEEFKFEDNADQRAASPVDLDSGEEYVFTDEDYKVDLADKTPPAEDLDPDTGPFKTAGQYFMQNVGQPVAKVASEALSPALEFLDRGPRASGAMASEFQDVYEENKDPMEAFNSSMVAAWQQLKGSKTPTLRYGDIVEMNLLKEGMSPSNASDLATIAGFAHDGVTDFTNLGLGVGKGLLKIPLLQKAANRAVDFTQGMVSPGMKKAEANMRALGADPKAPTKLDRVMGLVGGVPPDQLAYFRAHSKKVTEATDVGSLANTVQEKVVDPIARDLDTFRVRRETALSEFNTAKDLESGYLAKVGSPETVGVNFSKAVESLRKKASSLSTHSFKIAREHGGEMPVEDIRKVIDDFKLATTNGSGIPDPDLAGTFNLLDQHFAVLLEQNRNRPGIPVVDVKALLKDKLHYNRAGPGQADLNLNQFQSNVSRAWKEHFWTPLNNKTKDYIDPDFRGEYLDTMQETARIARFLDDNDRLIGTPDRIEGMFKTISGSLNSMSSKLATDEIKAASELAALTGDHTLASSYNEFVRANRILVDKATRQKHFDLLPEAQSFRSAEESFYTAQEISDSLTGIKGVGPEAGVNFVHRLTKRGKRLDKLTDSEYRTIAAVNEIMSTPEQPFNLMVSILDAEAAEALSLARGAGGPGGSRMVNAWKSVAGGIFGGAAAMNQIIGGNVDSALVTAMALLMTGGGAALGFGLDRYGPAAARLYANLAIRAGDIGIKGTNISLKGASALTSAIIDRAPMAGLVSQMLNPKGELMQNGALTITDPSFLRVMRTAILSTPGIKNKEKAVLIDKINRQDFSFTLSGPNPYDVIAEKLESGKFPHIGSQLESDVKMKIAPQLRQLQNLENSLKAVTKP